jgi:hypothetical protein
VYTAARRLAQDAYTSRKPEAEELAERLLYEIHGRRAVGGAPQQPAVAARDRGGAPPHLRIDPHEPEHRHQHPRLGDGGRPCASDGAESGKTGASADESQLPARFTRFATMTAESSGRGLEWPRTKSRIAA